MFVNCVCQFIYYSGSIGPFNLGNIGIVGNGIIKGTRSLPFPAITDGIVGGRVVVWVLDLSKSVDDGDIDDDESSFDPTDNESVEFLIGAFSGVTNGKVADEYIDFVEYSVVSWSWFDFVRGFCVEVIPVDIWALASFNCDSSVEDVSEFKNRGSGNFSLAKEKNFFTVIGTNGLIRVEKRGNGDSAGSS